MNNHLIKKISLTALLHDIIALLKEIPIDEDSFVKELSSWFNDTLVSDVLRHSSFRTLIRGNDINEMRLVSEIICEAENLSLGSVTTSPGVLSPVKSLFSCFDTTKKAYSVPDSFFHANELSNDLLLETKSSKKDLLFAPSYQLTAFVEELSCLYANISSPRINTVLSLLEKYFWSITLAHHGSDFFFSIFDHAKLTAALGGALYIYLAEKHKEIFISKNLSIIHDKIHNPTEPCFLCLNLQVSSLEPVPEDIQQYILHIAINSVLALYGLDSPSIFFQSSTNAVLLLPNVFVQNIYTLLKKLNIQLLDTPAFSPYYITFSTIEFKGNDLFQHFSSNRSMLNVINPDSCDFKSIFFCFENVFLQKNYKSFFGPDLTKETAPSPVIQPDLSEKAVWTPIFSPAPPDLRLSSRLKPENGISTESGMQHKGIYYFDGPIQSVHETLEYLRNADCVFSHTLVRTSRNSTGKTIAELKFLLPDLSNCFSEYVNISQLHNYYSFISYFIRYGLTKTIDTCESGSCLRYSYNNLEFEFAPIHSSNLFSALFKQIESFIPHQLIPVHLYISPYTNTASFVPLKESRNTVFIFNTSLSFEQYAELCALNTELHSVFNNCTNHEKQDILAYCNRFITNESYLLKLPDSIYSFSETMFSFENPLLAARWFYYSIHLIQAEGEDAGEHKNVI